MRAIRANRLAPVIRNFGSPPPPKRDSQRKGFSLWGRAKGAAKASCGETVVQKGVFGESVSFFAPLKVFRTISSVLRANLKWGREETDSPKTPFWTTVSPHDAFAAPLARPEFGNPETIRENQAIRANLRIDSRESGHLRSRFSGPRFCLVPPAFSFVSPRLCPWTYLLPVPHGPLDICLDLLPTAPLPHVQKRDATQVGQAANADFGRPARNRKNMAEDWMFASPGK